jgi:hypothetical protein
VLHCRHRCIRSGAIVSSRQRQVFAEIHTGRRLLNEELMRCKSASYGQTWLAVLCLDFVQDWFPLHPAPPLEVSIVRYDPRHADSHFAIHW